MKSSYLHGGALSTQRRETTDVAEVYGDTVKYFRYNGLAGYQLISDGPGKPSGKTQN